ncbi:MAG TPA: phosphodiesterase, partial [Paraburkholderia sp.]
MLLAQISDLHIKQPGALAYRRVDTAAYFARCVGALNALQPRPDAVIVTGDLVDQGDPEQYAHLKSLLAPLSIPYYLLVGNHDDRAALRATFPERQELFDGGEFVQYAVDIGPLRVLALDSLVPGASGGQLCDVRLAWLAAQLDAAQDRPVIVALHHPPFVSGIGHMDRVRLEPLAARRLEALIARYPNVERVICGHI